MSDDPHQRLFDDLRELFGDADLVLPPPVVEAMGTRIEEWEPGERVVMSFPVRAEWTGPTGFVQGGMLGVAFDNAIGPVAYTAVGGLVVSVGLSITFLRPLRVDPERAEEERFTVEVHLVEATRRFAFCRAEARDARGRLLAACTSELFAPEADARDARGGRKPGGGT